jgi:putative inorganic carbon (HCO3(-)) transporter
MPPRHPVHAAEAAIAVPASAGGRATPGWRARRGGPQELLSYEATQRIPFMLFLGYVLFVYLQGGFRYPVLGNLRFEFIIGAILSVFAAISISRRKTSTNSPVKGWMIAMIIVCVMMTGFSYSPSASWQLFWDRVLKFMMLAVFIFAFVTNPNTLRGFMFAYLFAFLKMAQEGITGFFGGGLVWENQGTMRLHGPTPNYEHPNSFSGTQLGTIPFLLFLRTGVNALMRWAFLAQGVAAITIVVTTGSRTGYVALLVWVAVVLLRSKSKFKTIAIAAVAVLAVWPFIPDEYMARFETIFTQQDKEGDSIGLRKQIFDDAIKIWESHPFGVGIGEFTEVRQKTFGRDAPAHNLYLEIATDIGIQGLIVFLGFVLCSMWVAKRLSADFERQIARMNTHAPPAEEQTKLGRAPTRSRGKKAATEQSPFEKHLSDLKFMHGVSLALLHFLVIRLGFGLFSHDFYELYWWFAAGTLLALENMKPTATALTDHFCKTAPAAPTTEPTPAIAGSAAR